MSRWDSLWVDVHLATMTDTGEPYGAVRDGAIAIRDGRIDWLGRMSDLPGSPEDATTVRDGGAGWVTPGLIDCHTHLVFGGSRADEFEARLEGVSYEDLARAGGGILSTVRATREADEPTLLESALPRVDTLMSEGVTGIEIKSGYGLDPGEELKMLRVARRIGRERPVRIQTTLLGAHALPLDYRDRRAEFVEMVVREMIPSAVRNGLADAADAFCEGIGFTPAECEKVLSAALDAGLAVRLHADQLSDLGGAALAARLGARSADHLEYTSEEGVRAMAEAGTVAVLLPGAYYVVREERPPPLAALRRHGVPVAIATDANPGSSPLLSILTCLNLACTLFRMTPEEALAGVTVNAARALGWESEVGTLAAGKVADLAVWDVSHPRDLAYWIGLNPLTAVVRGGRMRDQGDG